MLSSNAIWDNKELLQLLQLVSKTTAVDFFIAIQPLDFRNKTIEILLQLSEKHLTTSFVLVVLFFVNGRLSTNL